MNLIFFWLIEVSTKKGQKTAKKICTFLGWYLNKLKKILDLISLFIFHCISRKKTITVTYILTPFICRTISNIYNFRDKYDIMIKFFSWSKIYHIYFQSVQALCHRFDKYLMISFTSVWYFCMGVYAVVVNQKVPLQIFQQSLCPSLVV